MSDEPWPPGIPAVAPPATPPAPPVGARGPHHEARPDEDEIAARFERPRSTPARPPRTQPDLIERLLALPIWALALIGLAVLWLGYGLVTGNWTEDQAKNRGGCFTDSVSSERICFDDETGLPVPGSG